MSTEKAYLSIENVSKFFGDVTAVDDVNLSVGKNQFLTILGPSGSGKTTLLQMIAGFEMVSKGSIYLNDEDISKKKPYQRNIGMLFQHYALFPHMTVEENVSYPLKLRKLKKEEIKKKVQEALELVQLDHLAKRYPRQLSGGQQQRVALARAIVYNPPLLLLDEPLSALDKNLRQSMQVELKNIQEQIGVTTISVTHDQEEALVMSDLVCVMNQGKIEQIATPREIYQYPKNEFVAKFIGEINLIKGTIDSKTNGEYIVTAKHNPETKFIIEDHWNNGLNTKDVYVAIRPEKLYLVTEERTYQNKINTKVIKKLFVGNSLKLQTETNYGTPILIEVPTGEADRIQEGDTITVGWDDSDATLIPDESSKE